MVAKKYSWTRELAREGMRAMALGWELAMPIFGGVLLGHYLDQQFETGYTFTLGLLVAGVFVGFYNIWRFGQRFAGRHDQKKDSAVSKEGEQ
ncbi:MAG: AtpZ/AtpI family protein [Anaerolineae bacterium]|nr:AtpZ/AtpI family protein [Anaerolineae bacterium]